MDIREWDIEGRSASRKAGYAIRLLTRPTGLRISGALQGVEGMQQVPLDRWIGGHAAYELSVRSNEAARPLEDLRRIC
jgi:hypothetical protein